MEKKMETIIMGYIGTTKRNGLHSWLTKGQISEV